MSYGFLFNKSENNVNDIQYIIADLRHKYCNYNIMISNYSNNCRNNFLNSASENVRFLPYVYLPNIKKKCIILRRGYTQYNHHSYI